MNDTIISTIITGVVSLIVGFITGYGTCKITLNKRIMKQKAGKSSSQIQIGEINGK